MGEKIKDKKVSITELIIPMIEKDLKNNKKLFTGYSTNDLKYIRLLIAIELDNRDLNKQKG